MFRSNFSSKNKMTCITILPANTRPTVAVAFSPNNQLLATATLYNEIMVWNLKTNKNVTRFQRYNDSKRCSVVFLSDNIRLIYVCGDSRIVVENIRNKTLRKEISCLSNMECIAVCWKKQIFASSSSTGEVSVWNENNLQRIQYLGSEHRRVHKVKFSNDGIFLATCSSEGSLSVWNLHGNKYSYTLERIDACKVAYFSNYLVDVSFSSDNKLIAGASEQNIYVLDTDSLTSLFVFQREHSLFVDISFVFNDSCIIYNSQLFNIKSGKMIAKLRPAASKHFKHPKITCMTMSSGNETIIAIGSEIHATRLWRLHNCNSVAKLGTCLLRHNVAPYVLVDIINFVFAHNFNTGFRKETEFKPREKIAFLVAAQKFFKELKTTRVKQKENS